MRKTSLFDGVKVLMYYGMIFSSFSHENVTFYISLQTCTLKLHYIQKDEYAVQSKRMYPIDVLRHRLKNA